MFELDLDNELMKIESLSVEDLQFFQYCSKEIKKIEERIEKIEKQDSEAIESLYRMNKMMSGLLEVYNFKFISCLLEINVFCFDYLRHKHKFGLPKKIPHDINYTINLVINEVKQLLKITTKNEIDIETVKDVMKECQNYIRILVEAEETNNLKITHNKIESQIKNQDIFNEELGILDKIELDKIEFLQIPDEKIGVISDYCEESREILIQFGLKLVELETSEYPAYIIDEIFRHIHTLKGSAKLLNIKKIETLAHVNENLLSSMRNSHVNVTPDLIDLLLDCKKLYERMITEIANRGPITIPLSSTISKIDTYGNEFSGFILDKKNQNEPGILGNDSEVQKIELEQDNKDIKQIQKSETIRITTEKLDEVLNTASEVFITRIRLQNDLYSLNSSLFELKKIIEIDSNIRKNEFFHANLSSVNDYSSQTKLKGENTLNNIIELNSICTVVEDQKKKLTKSIDDLEELSGRLQSSAMNIRMVPVSYAFDRFPTEVRAIARKLNKKVKLIITGADTELDKVLINQMIEPILHILRNAIDHGIEESKVRLSLGKSETGTIFLSAYYQGSEAIIEITDDGQGIDTDKILAKACDNGYLTKDYKNELPKDEILNLIFEPGFSTSEKLSTISGRGVGMDAVRNAINQVQGSVSVETTPNVGSKFKIKLPLSLAVAGVLLVEENTHIFAFPILHIEEILTIEKNNIKQFSENFIFTHRGESLAVSSLSQILEFQPSEPISEFVQIVILSDDDKKKCIMVDSVLGKQDVMIKNLGDYIYQIPYIMGCTILSDNRLVLILNTWELVNHRK